MGELSHLLSPITVRGLELRNRAVVPPMGTGYGDLDGRVTDRLVAYLARRAAGGFGLIITEVCAIDPRGRGFPTEIGCWSDDFIGELAMIPEAVHREGAGVALQLHHAGRETFEAFAGGTPEAPSAIPSPLSRQPCEEMSPERIAVVVEAYGRAAARAREAGFDAVEVHGAHGYLINQFLSPFSNQREDEYGGSDENRARMALEVLASIRRHAGEDFPVILRVSADEVVRGGYDLEFMERLSPRLVDAGADVIHASVGVPSTRGQLTIPSMDTGQGFNLFRARALKRVVDVPVIAVGRIVDPKVADEAIARGDADMVSFGRQSLTDPDTIAKAADGRFEDIRTCWACNQGCIERLGFELKPITCTINPGCGQEYLGEGGPAAEPCTVWIAGAGPAGISAALSASEAGHRVSLFERGAELGGQLVPASVPPGKEVYKSWLAWAARMLERRGVEVRTWTELTAGDVRAGRPDRLVIATGSLPSVPDIPGIEGPNVLDARALLTAARLPDGPAVVIGAGYAGMEVADYLCSLGVAVAILEMSPVPPVGKLTAHGWWMHHRLREAGGELVLGAKVTGVGPDSLTYSKDGREEMMALEGPVVTTTGGRPDTALAAELDRAGVGYTLVGDAREPRRLLEAIHEGHAAGLLQPGSEA